jgi:phospholipase/carboxylesterase
MPHPGSRLAPLSGRTRQLVILLHGFGADGDDLISLGEAWQARLPDAAFFAPHAPEPCIAGFGRQWFPLTFRDPGERWRGVNHAAPGLARLVAEELAAADLQPERLALVGFSQGAMMALHVGLRMAPAPAAIVGLSGALILAPGAGPDSLASVLAGRPPVLLLHGDQDDVIPPEALSLSAQALTKAGISCESQLAAGLGHGIDEGGLDRAGRFLAKAFSAPERT